MAFAVIVMTLGGGAAAAADAGFMKVAATPIDFGRVYTEETFTGTGTVTVAAPAGLNFRVTVDGGFHFHGSRHLKNSAGAEAIPYSLYSDAGCSLPLGDGGAGGTFSAESGVAGTGDGRDELITIYGRVTVPPRAPPGLYLDGVTVTVVY